MTPEIFVIAALAVLFAGFSKGGFGGSVAFVSSAILALVMKPIDAVTLMLPLLIMMDFATLSPFWKKWDFHQAKVLIIGSLPGMILGALLFTVISDQALRLFLGCIALAFVLWRMAPLFLPKKDTPKQGFSDTVGYIAGMVLGLTSFISHAGGPPAAMYLLSQNLNKTRYHSTVTLVFWVVNALKVVPYAFLGVFSLDLLKFDLILAPIGLFGVWLGVKAHHLIPEKWFFGLVYTCLGITGCKLIFDSLT